MKTLDIPGGTARFREKSEIRIGHRQDIEAATIEAFPALSKLPTDDPSKLKELNIAQLGLTATEARSVFALEASLVVATLIDWSLDEPIPTHTTIRDLEAPVYEALTAALPQLGILIGETDFDPPKPDDPAFATSPTAPSADSVIGLRADREPALTDTSINTGESTSTAAPSTV